MITNLCLFHLMTRRGPTDHTNPRELLGGCATPGRPAPRWLLYPASTAGPASHLRMNRPAALGNPATCPGCWPAA